MSDWSIFNKDLSYKYVRFLLKDLSSAESYYLRVLRDGIDEQINTSINWFNIYREDLEHLHDKDDWTDYYDDSELEQLLLTLRSKNETSGLKPLYDFYRSGGNLAYSHLGVKNGFYYSDEVAFARLSNYVRTVIDSINSEFSNGVKNLIGNHIEDKSLDQFNNDLLELRYTRLDSPFSVDNRCVFATKTEYARSVNTGLLQAYSNYGVDEFDWITSGLPNTCKDCLELEANSPYTLEEVIRLCPVHVNCVCSFKARLSIDDYRNLVSNPVVVDLTPKNK